MKLPTEGEEPVQARILEETLEINPEDLKIGQCIGKGAYGEVYSAEWSNVQVRVDRSQEENSSVIR